MSSPLPARSIAKISSIGLAPQQPQLRIAPLAESPTVDDADPVIRPRGYLLKRPFDNCLAGIALAVLLPALLAVAVAIKLTSKGPVFYRQRRLGVGEHPFTILKFRSMRVDADKIGPGFTQNGDPRITPIGRILRRTSVDELPQLINVLRGEMSLIGPRPYIGFELERWSAEDRATRATVRPGLSGLAQAAGRSLNTPDESRRLDLRYVRECSLFLDLAIILRTLKAVVIGRGNN